MILRTVQLQLRNVNFFDSYHAYTANSFIHWHQYVDYMCRVFEIWLDLDYMAVWLQVTYIKYLYN